MGNKPSSKKATKKEDNTTTNSKYNEDIIQQLLMLNIATRPEIMKAMDNVVNANDINEIAEYLTTAAQTDTTDKNDNDAPADDPADNDAVYIMSNGVLYKISSDDYNRLMQEQAPDTNEATADNPNPNENETQNPNNKDKDSAKEARELEYNQILKESETNDELLVHGYIHKHNKLINIKAKILSLCLQFYHVNYANLLKLCGNEFINKNEEKITFNAGIRGYDMIVFYFSASWCPPSFQFTPKLAKLHEVAMENNYKLQIIFVSLDRSKSAMLDYFKNHHGNYLAICYEDEEKKNLLGNVFECEYIPHLCVINNSCSILDDSGRKTISDVGDKYGLAIQLWQGRNMQLCKEIAMEQKQKRINDEIENEMIKKDEHRDEMIVNGYIHKYNEESEWIMPSGIFVICFDFYHISYKKLLKLCGNKFIKQNGDKTTFDDGIKGYDMIGFYFSAIWCPPSKEFTPKLAKLYEFAMENDYKLQVIFISSDQSEQEMMDYFENYHGDYLALCYEDKQRKELLGKVFECKYIPHLCIINNQCEMIDAMAVNTVVNHKQNAIKIWQERDELLRKQN